MYQQPALYINGRFLHAEGRKTQPVTNPATGDTKALTASPAIPAVRPRLSAEFVSACPRLGAG